MGSGSLLICFVALLFFQASCKKPVLAQGSNTVTQLKDLKTFINIGDSNTSTNVISTPPGDANNWPYQLGLINPYIADAYQANTARAGTNTEQMLQIFNSDILPYLPTNNKELVVVSVMGGTNDAAEAINVDSTYNHLKTLWATCRNTGAKVIAMTVLRNGNPTYQTRIDAINAKIVSDRSLYDYLVRSDLILTDPSDTTYYKLDQIHLNARGSKVLAYAVNAAL